VFPSFLFVDLTQTGGATVIIETSTPVGRMPTLEFFDYLQ